MDLIVRSVSEGDADTILKGVGEYFFPPIFKEYVLKERLKWSRCTPEGLPRPSAAWVFWSQHEIEPSLSIDNCPDFNPNVCAIPKVRDNIRRALQKFIPKVDCSLVQFWAATTTLEGRTKLTTQYQPFALGLTYFRTTRQLLCEYRMGMCSSEYNNLFYGDTEGGEEQLGLPGRVFLHKFPESSPDVKYYSTKEYPQRDLALRCHIRESWAVPVFEHSSQTCVGVLEMVSQIASRYLYDESFLRHMHDSFQEFGLQIFYGYRACKMESREQGKRVKGLATAFQKLKTALRSVCKIHQLPLAMTWVPCSACNGLQRCKLRNTDVEFCLGTDLYLAEFLKLSKQSHLRNGLVAKRALSSPNMLCCSDITQLNIDEYPLIPCLRHCQLSGWFTICLQSIHTGNYIYVIEFFLSAKSKEDENILTTLNSILGTMEEKFKTFRLASGKELGELTSVEVIYFQNDQKIHSVQTIQATRDFSVSSIPSSVQSSASVANTRPGFQDADMGIDLNSDPFSDSDPSFEQSSTSVANTRPGFQDAVTIKAKYASIEIVLKLSSLCRLVELQQEVAKQLMLEVGTYHVAYQDEEDGLVLVPCDEDLQAYVDGNTSPVVLLLPK